tara:strand:- start:469 stop:1242 length:774 start_codon:yes stop_codon:yes gene_type:complete
MFRMPFRTAAAKGNLIAAVAGATLLAGIGATAAAPVDLSTWQADGTGGSWNLQSGNNAVLQTQNGPPTVFHSGTDSQGLALSGTIRVQTTSDDDFVGFVLGYQQGELTSASADYLLVDWKQGAQAGQQAGLALSRITGSLAATGSGTDSDAWQHTGVVSELARATTLGNTGWADHTTYNFDITFTASLVRVAVNGLLELEIFGSFTNGAFGFYNYSQQSVLYAGIEEDEAIPEPAGIALFGLGLLCLAARRRLSARI